MGDVSARRFWELLPANWYTMTGRNSEEVNKQDTEEIMASLPDLKKMRVIEIASGIGRFTGRLSARAERVLATDFVQKFVDKNRELHSHLGNVDFQCECATKLDFEPESWDFVFTNWILVCLREEDIIDFLSKVLIWLTPNGLFHVRETNRRVARPDSIIEKLQPIVLKLYDYYKVMLSYLTFSGDQPDKAPIYLRPISQYLTLIDQLRVKDDQTGRYMRFQILWTKTVDAFQAVGAFGQAHMLLRKVWVDQDETTAPLSHEELFHQFINSSLNEREGLVKEMAVRKAVWKASSPFEILIMKILTEQANITEKSTVLNICFDPAAAVSPENIAKKVGCIVFNYDRDMFMFDYNESTADDRRLRLNWISDPNQEDWHWPDPSFHLIIACHLSSNLTNVENTLVNIKSRLAPGGKLILLEKSSRSKNTQQYDSLGKYTIDDITNQVKAALIKSIADIEHKLELQQLQQTYQSWLDNSEMNWHIITAINAI